MDIATAREKLIFAMDVAHFEDIQRLVNIVHPHVGMFKVGLELFISQGPEVVRMLRHFRPVMLDLKLHDIPETVARAVNVAGDLGVKFLTLHVQQKATLERAAKAAEKHPGMKLLGVTVLTSMTDDDLIDLEQMTKVVSETNCHAVAHRVLSLVCFAYNLGIDGFVCSPKEVAAIRKIHMEPSPPPYPPRPILVTPGIVPGTETRDHKRSASPGEAIRAGSDYLVVGRPIRDAADPVKAAQDIVKEIAEAC
jgi:orotidine-5'-phosphate decarboxylase